MERTDYVAKTAAGALIRTFADRTMAMAWADVEGRDFPGYVIALREERRIVRERVLRRDRSRFGAAA